MRNGVAEALQLAIGILQLGRALAHALLEGDIERENARLRAGTLQFRRGPRREDLEHRGDVPLLADRLARAPPGCRRLSRRRTGRCPRSPARPSAGIGRKRSVYDRGRSRCRALLPHDARRAVELVLEIRANLASAKMPGSHPFGLRRDGRRQACGHRASERGAPPASERLAGGAATPRVFITSSSSRAR